MSTPVRIWDATLPKLDYLCQIDHRRLRAEEINWLVEKELRGRGVNPDKLPKHGGAGNGKKRK